MTRSKSLAQFIKGNHKSKQPLVTVNKVKLIGTLVGLAIGIATATFLVVKFT